MIALAAVLAIKFCCWSIAFGQAPGDYSATCRSGVNAAAHIFPAEWRVLVDNYDYQNLYNPDASPAPVWTDNDVDGDGLSYDSLVGGTCTYPVRPCTGQLTQNNWLFSQHIRYEDAKEVFYS